MRWTSRLVAEAVQLRAAHQIDSVVDFSINIKTGKICEDRRIRPEILFEAIIRNQIQPEIQFDEGNQIQWDLVRPQGFMSGPQFLDFFPDLLVRHVDETGFKADGDASHR